MTSDFYFICKKIEPHRNIENIDFKLFFLCIYVVFYFTQILLFFKLFYRISQNLQHFQFAHWQNHQF
jgi:hypothetical protein